MPSVLGDDGRLSKLYRKLRWSATGLTGKQPPGVRTLYRGHGSGMDGIPWPEMVQGVDGPAFIEPKFGYVISGTDWLLEESAGPNFPYTKASWRVGIPSRAQFSKAAHVRRGTFNRYPEAISLRHWWEWNYWHFWFDVLGKLSLFSKAGLDVSRLPLILGKYAREVPFVEQIITRGGLAGLNWIVGDDYVEADRVYYCKTMRPYRERMDFLMDLMGLEPQPRGERRLFISRSRSANRRLTNHQEVWELLRSHGFEEIHLEETRVDDQIAAFSQAACVVGVTGAGFANLVFRRLSPLGVVELASSDFYGADFNELCWDYGHRWTRVFGVPAAADTPQHADFRIDVGALEVAMAQVFPAGSEVPVA
jgi:capsular polysaccharide biosynthesis protein